MMRRDIDTSMSKESINKDIERVYFDYNATAPIFANAMAEMLCYVGECMNASALHYDGRKAKQLLEESRSKIASLTGANNEYKVVFTSSGTEANNLALRGVGLPVITTATEHASVFNLVGKGIIPVDSNGLVKLDELEKILKQLDSKVLVSVIMANNETGVIQPISSIAKLTKKYGHLLHTDAVQAFCKIPFSVAELGVDLATISGHKFGGPVCTACLIVRKNIEIEPILVGGGQEYGLRAGTQSVLAIRGFSAAAEIGQQRISRYKEIKELRDYLETSLQKICPNLIIFGKDAPRLPNTSSIAMPNVKNETQLVYFDLNGISVSSGSACSSSRLDYPRVQIAMGYESSIAQNAIRVSLGRYNTKQEVEYFIEHWKALYKKHNNKNKKVA